MEDMVLMCCGGSIRVAISHPPTATSECSCGNVTFKLRLLKDNSLLIANTDYFDQTIL